MTEVINTILDRLVFRLNAAQSCALAEALARPHPPPDALRRLLATKAPWQVAAEGLDDDREGTLKREAPAPRGTGAV